MNPNRALSTRAVEKPWGQERLPAPFASPEGKRIGEIWFKPPAELPELLVKYLFTSEALSVQVHPSDERAPPGTRGKDECWLIVDARPGARLAVGFGEPVTHAQVRAAALDGSIEQMLAWHAVGPGDFIYLPAGTVHAIGAGISLIEVQQNSDVTYRLYDYGRPRELHLDKALEVADLVPHDSALRRRVPSDESTVLVEGPHFRLDLVQGTSAAEMVARYCGAPLLVIPLDGPIAIGGEAIAAGSCGLAASFDRVRLSLHSRVLIAQPV